MAKNQEMEDPPLFIWATNYPRLCWWQNGEDPTLKLLCVINRPLDDPNEDEAPYAIVKCEDSKFDNKAEAHAADLTPAQEVGFGKALPRHRVEVLVFAIRESYKFAVISKESEKARPPPALLLPQVPVDPPKVATSDQNESSPQLIHHLAETDPNGRRGSGLDIGYVRKRKLEIAREKADGPPAKRSASDENQPSTSRAGLDESQYHAESLAERCQYSDGADSTDSYQYNPDDCPEIRITPPHQYSYELNYLFGQEKQID